MRRLVISLALALVVAPAHAQDPRALLQRGIALHRDAAFAASVAALEQARQGKLDQAEQVECAFYLASGYLALGSVQAARRELKTVLELSPSYELPQYTSPKVASLFRDVKEEQERLPLLKALPPRRLGPHRLVIAFEPSRMGGTAYGVAMWRWRGESAFREMPLGHDGDTLVAELSISRGGTLEYYAEARGPSGLAQAASKDRPLELPVAAPPPGSARAAARPAASAAVVAGAPAPGHKPRSVAKAWWLWTTVGVVAAAGLGVGLYFGLQPPSGTGSAVIDFQVQ